MPPTTSELITWVYTQDLDSTSRFYQQILGLSLDRDEGSARIFRINGQSSVGVCRAFGDRIVEPKGGMISIVTDDVDGWYAKLRSAGAEIPDPPHKLDQFGIYTFFVNDPNGYVIEFQQFLDNG